MEQGCVVTPDPAMALKSLAGPMSSPARPNAPPVGKEFPIREYWNGIAPALVLMGIDTSMLVVAMSTVLSGPGTCVENGCIPWANAPWAKNRTMARPLRTLETIGRFGVVRGELTT